MKLIYLITYIDANIQLLMVLVYLATTIAVNIQFLKELDNLGSSKLTMLI